MLGHQLPARRLVLLSGSSDWAKRVTAQLLELYKRENMKILRADGREPSPRAWMGQELDVAVLSSRRRRFLDCFGGVCGALRGGGVLLLQTPSFQDWVREHTGARWCRLLAAVQKDPTVSPWITQLSDGDVIPVESPLLAIPERSRKRLQHETLKPNEEQSQLLEAILKITPSTPLIVCGRRGRGKSAGLGMAAALILQRTGGTVLVTSPSKDATFQLFQAAEQFLGNASGAKRVGQYEIRAGKRGVLKFVYPKELLKASGAHRLKSAFLVVDEAAGLPVNSLLQLLSFAGRAVLATTLDGYEGSGNGMLVRGLPRLRAARKGLQVMELSSAWRWEEGCPLEALSRSTLLLDALPATLDEDFARTSATDARLEHVERDKLVSSDERHLKELYGILKQGHYKTKPSDLEVFLDAKGVIWLAMRHAGQNLGLTISVVEDPIEGDATIKELWLRQRQVSHSLTAQTLSRDAGFPQAADFRFVRMMRWCLHPAMRRHGLGLRLLSQSLDILKTSTGVDAVAAHFGATAWLIKLWIQQGGRVVFISHGCDPSSGQHSVSVLIPLNQRTENLVTQMQVRLAEQLLGLLSGPLHDLEGNALKELLRSIPIDKSSQGINAQDEFDIWSFAWGARELSHSQHSLLKAALESFRRGRNMAGKDGLRDEELMLDLLQGRPIHSEDRLRKAVRRLLQESDIIERTMDLT